MIVLKFGGSSVAKSERIVGVVNILKSYYTKKEKFTVVFSAFGGVTDNLIALAHKSISTNISDSSFVEDLNVLKQRHIDTCNELLGESLHLSETISEINLNFNELHDILHGLSLVKELTPRTLDFIVSFGERNSAYIIAQYMRHCHLPAQYLDARKLIKTNENYGAAKVDFDTTNQLIKEYYSQNNDIQVVTGFVSSTQIGNHTTTLGRGGSDYTAAILGAALHATAIEIWTDVDGVLTADPRKVRKAFTIPTMTYKEAMEMSHFGAKVIYPPTIQPAFKNQIPLYIKNTFNPDFKGTYISENQDDTSVHPVKGISSINHVALATLQGGGMFGVPGIAARLFNSLAKASINIILITQGSSESSISFAITPSDASKAIAAVEEEFQFEIKTSLIDRLKVEDELSVIAIIGENMRYRPGIAGKMFQSLGKNGVNIVAIAQGSSELNISTVIPLSDEAKALNALHETFFLSDTKSIHLYIVGIGLIGSTLIRQIRHQTEYLKQRSKLEIKIVGIANSRKMYFNENGIDLSDWQEILDMDGAVMDMNIFVDSMKHLNLQNSIFIDNTATELVSNFYESILDSSISISTPNKLATSSSYLKYQRLKAIAEKRNVKFMYETNVGAGLPIISTLNDLINSGDEIIKIEGVLSGSLSYIFNNFSSAGKQFSNIVSDARDLGFTEPDPRIDLNGIDIRRKILILAREIGLHIEAKDVKIETFLPDACQNAKTIDDFFVELKHADSYFDNLIREAEADGKVLRMIAKLEGGEASISLQEISLNNPFASLSGSDNMIVFTTERYKERPLIVRGPGAGAEVTAAGVFAEIITIANYIS
ncbi:MAG: bifunctional aspartate kinase/homoserine dehydrogenase I [Saprospiraceae bacterium]|nr:bifunctional aspartate kinase/homoserine dehydrogenase I [Saprospiraceae bacterium]